MLDRILQKVAEYLDVYLSKRGKVDPTKWEVHIARVSNGFILTMSPFAEEAIGEAVLVYEDDCNVFEEGCGERHSFLDMCWELVEYFGLSGSRYSKERIHITLKPGDKWEGEDGVQDDEDSLSLLDE